MFFSKKRDNEPEKQALGDEDETSTTGEFKIALHRLDEAIEQKKNITTSAKQLAKKLTDSIPPAPRKPRTA